MNTPVGIVVLGIPNNSKFEGELSLEFVGILGNPKNM